MRFTHALLSALFGLCLVGLCLVAVGCEGPLPLEPLPEPEMTPAAGDPCEVVLEASGAVEFSAEGGNFMCGGEADETLLFCRCDAFENGDECPDGAGTLVAQGLIDDCPCDRWFEGDCPVE